MVKPRIESYEMSDIEVYSSVRDGARYPVGFWEGITGLHSAINILKYVFEDILKWSIDDIKKKATTKVFEENKLKPMVNHVFDGSIYIALAEAYPELKEWAEKLYQKDDRKYKGFERKRYSNEELIKFLQEKATELNRLPRTTDMQRPSSIVFTNRFGSWEKSLIKAGLIEDIYGSVNFEKYSKEDVLKHLKEIAVSKERMLERAEIFEMYPEGLVKEYFGSILSLQKVMESDYTKDELLNILKIKKEQLGRTPTNKDMNFPKAIVFIDIFGSWQDAIDELENS